MNFNFGNFLLYCCLISCYGCLTTRGTFSKTLKVLTTERDIAKFSDGSGAKLKSPPTAELVDVTVCLRFFEFIILDKYLISSKYENESVRPIFAIDSFDSKWFGFQSIWTSFNTD